jgi:hypothetical protein
MEIIVEMDLERETKGTFRYLESGPSTSHKIGTLYLKKSAVGIGIQPPKHIRVRVSGGDVKDATITAS